MNLSKSRFCSAVQCNKKLWLELNKPEEIDESNNESVLDICIAESVGNIIKLDIRSDPINFIPNTTTIEQIIATTTL